LHHFSAGDSVNAEVRILGNNSKTQNAIYYNKEVQHEKLNL